MRLSSLQGLGEWGLRHATNLGTAVLLLLALLRESVAIFSQPRLLLEQLYAIGTKTLSIIAVSGLFVGMVLALQGYAILARFGADTALGLMVSAALVRELGPVLAALLFAGRAGSAVTAEIGLMKTTEQISSLQMMAINPVRRILVPRWIAGCLSVPLLAALFSAVGVVGAWLLAKIMLMLDDSAFWTGMQFGIDFADDILNGVIKSAVFGFIVTWIAIYQGYHATPTSQGVSQATTRTVVQSSLLVLGTDLLLTYAMFGSAF
ncbi:MAG: lipid asymmetry maintenance ABC transporter permease subunit MlaE [Pseudomonadota bacterium]